MAAETLKIPIFPLQDVVLFPQAAVSLHIFEPRYKKMISAVLEAEERLLGLVQLKPGWEHDYYGAPPVYRSLGVGRISRAEKWHDGRYDIVVEGLLRGKVVGEELTPDDYRVAEVEVLTDASEPEAAAPVEEARSRLLPIYQKVLNAVPEELQSTMFRDVALMDEPSAGMVADLLAHFLVEDPYAKQGILGELDVERRLKLVQIQLRQMLRPREA